MRNKCLEQVLVHIEGNLGGLLEDKTGVYLEGGHIFGREGEAFMRMNIACPRHILMEALEPAHAVVRDTN